MKRTRVFSFLAALLLCAVCAGCSEDGGNATAAAPTAKTSADVSANPALTPKPVTPMEGGAINLSMRMPKTLNPLNNTDDSVDAALRLVFEPLLKLDETFRPVPNLADYELAADGLSAVFTLKSGLKWSDGVPITAADIAYTLEALRTAPANAIYAADVTNVRDWLQLNESSIKINFLQPFGGVMYMFTFPIIPEHYYKNAPAGADMKPPCSGPYQIESYTVQKELLLVKNDGYFWKKPYIYTIHFILTPDRETALESLAQGIVDAIPAEISDWGRLRSVTAESVEYTTMYYDFIGFNFANARLRDKDVREAICRAVDLDKIINDYYLTHAARTLTPVNPESWLYDASVTAHTYDIEAAKALIEKAGSAAPMRLLVNKENGERLKIADILVEGLAKIGITANLEVLPFDEYESRINARDYDMFIGGYKLSALPDLTFLFGSDNGDVNADVPGNTVSVGNVFNYSDTVMDGLLAQTAAAIGDAAYKTAMGDLQKYIASEIPCISLVFRKCALLCSPSVHGGKNPLYTDVYNGIQEWFLER